MAKVEILECETCGTSVVSVKTSKGKTLTADAVVTRIVMIDESGEELKVKRMLTGNRLHDETCRKEAGVKPEAKTKEKETGQPREGTEEQDECPVCDSTTSYRTWRAGDGTELEFRDCPDKHGRWWRRAKDGGAARWKGAREEWMKADVDKRQKAQGKEGGDVPF